MMKTVLLVLALAVAAMAIPPKWHQLQGYTFDKYLKDFGKKYATSDEHFQRRQIFLGNLAKIVAHNSLPEKNYKKGVNHLTDRTKDELKRMNGYKGHQLHSVVADLDAKHAKKWTHSGKARPASVDYRTTVPSILTAVKDQGQCGSCWAHGTTETIESYAAIKTGELFVLSQQQLTACAPNPEDCGGVGGCGGSTAEIAMSYLTLSGGQAQEWTYPYTAYQGTTGTCQYNNSISATPAVVSLDFYTKVPSNNQEAILDTLANVGPLIINVDASEWSSYESGVYDSCTYNISIDHVVQLVGYGHDNTLNVDYWIVRNSWSASFGEAGFIRLKRDATPTCGWDVNPQDGTGCKVGPNQLWACGQCGILFDALYPHVIHS